MPHGPPRVVERGTEDFRPRPGRIADGSRPPPGFGRAVLKAAGISGRLANPSRAYRKPATGAGRVAGAAARLRSTSRRVIVKALVVRHRGSAFRAAALATHITYLQRDGTSRTADSGTLFGAEGENIDGREFATRCADDRHHFRFIISPEDAGELTDLRAFTRDLMRQAEKDLGQRLDWVAVDHWNTDNPHAHVVLRGRSESGPDLVISRDFISYGLRNRAEELVHLELGPRPERQVQQALARDIGVERVTGVDRLLRALADSDGTVDLRRGSPIEENLRQTSIARIEKLEQLGLAEPIRAGRWRLAATLEADLKSLGERHDIIATMHRSLAEAGVDRGTNLSIHDGAPPQPIVGRLIVRGLDDELAGTAFAVIDGTDGRAHHIRFASLELASDTTPGAVVEVRQFAGQSGRTVTALAVSSDLPLAAQISADGATWLDRQLVSRSPSAIADHGFGQEVGEALAARTDHLIQQGLAEMRESGPSFARNLIATLRQRELQAVSARLAAETGRPVRPAAPGDPVVGIYTNRLQLASGRFAMLDDGLGFQLVPWKPALEQHLGKQVSGLVRSDGGVNWNLGRSRGLSR